MDVCFRAILFIECGAKWLLARNCFISSRLVNPRAAEMYGCEGLKDQSCEMSEGLSKETLKVNKCNTYTVLKSTEITWF